MVMLRSLGTSSGGDSPTKGVYPAEIVNISDFERKPALKFKPEDPDKVNIQCKIGFKLFEFPYDPDIDTKDWEGETIYGYFVFQKEQMKDQRNADGTVEQVVDRIFDSYLDKRSTAFDLLSGIMGRPPTREDEIDLESYIGVKLDLGIEPKDSGWPTFTSFAKRRATRRPAAATPAPAPKPTTPDDDSLAGTAFADDDE